MTRRLDNLQSLTRARYARGMSLWTILFIGVLLIIVGGAALKATPSYLEFLSIKSAVQSAGKEGSVRDIRRTFDRISVIDNISSITSKDLTIEKNDDGGHSVKFQYEKQIPLAGPVSLLIDYAGNSE